MASIFTNSGISKVRYKIFAKIEGSFSLRFNIVDIARISKDSSNRKTAISSRKANNIKTASNSKFERNSRTLATSGMTAIAGRPATVTHKELKELKGWQQQQECLSQF